MLQGRNSIQGWRVFTTLGLILLLFSVVAARYYWLMVINHETYNKRANANYIRAVPITAARGIIFDRNNNILVDNSPAYSVAVIPVEVKKYPESLNRLGEIMDVSLDLIEKRIKQNQRGRFAPAIIFSRVPFEKISRLQEGRLELPGVTYSIEPIRSYPEQAEMSHLLGYTREIDQDYLNRVKTDDNDYEPGDEVGWKGLEKTYEAELHGSRGYRYMEVNALGQEIGENENRPPIHPIPGNDLRLTIDLNFQNIVSEAIGDSSGAIIIINYKSGEILTYLSQPGYESSVLSGRIKEEVWAELINNPKTPLYDRVVQGLYPPGSVLKLVAATYLFENEKEQAEYRCTGKLKWGNREFGCWKKVGHGKIKLMEAIEQSCNVYFFNSIEEIGLENWSLLCKNYGFGENTGIDIYGEKDGTVPDEHYMDGRYGKNNWTKGNLLNMVIGQGDVLVTPIQLAQYAAIIANKGIKFEPHLVKEVIYHSGRIKFINQKNSEQVVNVSDETWQKIHEGMRLVVNGKKGTAKSARQKKMTVYGKTGTSQNTQGEDHAWFIGFIDNPDLPIA